MNAAKSELYRDLGRQLASLLAGESDLGANAANMAALLYHGLPEISWAGFYWRCGDAVVLGPFQGKPACVRIDFSEGVCGAAATRAASVLVQDVDQFPGHIACDPASRSELVIPLVADGFVFGVLDLDSPHRARFDDVDRQGCEDLITLFVAHHRPPPRSELPADIDHSSFCRLPLPGREDLDEDIRQIYDRLVDPEGGSLRGLRGPGGIMLHSPALARLSRPLNHYLRHEAGLGARVRELAILATARECDSGFEWEAHEPAAQAAGLAADTLDLLRRRGDTRALDPADAIVVGLAREMLGTRNVTADTFAQALHRFGRRKLVDLVALIANYAGTAALLTAFDMQPDRTRPPPLPRLADRHG